MTLKSSCFYLTLNAGLLFLLPSSIQAQPTAHYCPGSEGILGASVPPPGIYLRDYNVFYTADRANNASGQSAGPANFSVFAYAQVPRLIWVTDLKFLGGNVGVNSLLPITDQNVTAGPYNSSTFGVGDLFVDGFLAWHPQKFDFVFGCGVWMPTGNSSAPPTTDAGLGYWANMLTFGGTWHLDQDKTWAVSLLNRYEINGEQRDTHITPGEAYTLEWGLSKTFHKNIDVGAIGYYQQKVTTDSGTGASSHRECAVAVGPEICAVIPKIEVHASLRYYYEVMAENRSQGQGVTLTLTKRF